MINGDTTRISVVMCTHNGATYVEEQLASISAQTYPIYELIVVDDASTDGTVEKVQAFAAANPLVRFFRNDHILGYNKNFEKAICLATGEVIAIADQDDYWLPQKLERMIAAWQPQHPVIYCNTAIFSGTDPGEAQEQSLMRRFEGSDARKIAVYNTVSGHALLVRSALVPLALPFSSGVYYDWWLTMVAASNGGVQYLPEVLVHQRWHSANASGNQGSTTAQRHQSEKEMVLRNLAQFCTTPGMSGPTKQFFKALHDLWLQAQQGTGRWQLFYFLMRHRRLVYFSKRRKAAFFSAFKRSYNYAFR